MQTAPIPAGSSAGAAIAAATENDSCDCGPLGDDVAFHRWKVDGVWRGDGDTFSWTFTATGNHAVNLYVDDLPSINCANDNKQLEATMTVTVVDTDPTVAITQPANFAKFCIGPEVVVKATASHEVGIDRVEFSYSGPSSGTIGTDVHPPDCDPHYCATWHTTGLAAGTYTITATAYDVCGRSKTDSITVYLVTIHLTYPSDGSKLTGSVTGERDTLMFYVRIEAHVEPVAAADTASVTFCWKKGESENSAEGTYDGNGDFHYDWDITQRFTSTTGGRYQLRATVAVAGGSCEAPEKPNICIKKGEQIWRTAQDWLHYPYHFAGTGRYEYPQGTTSTYCPKSSDPMPADGYSDHTPYDTSTHPAENQNHHCCYDCSAFSAKMYSHLGVAYVTPWVAATQYSELSGWDIATISNAVRGDLLYYGNPISHVSVKGSSTQRRDAPSSGQWTATRDGLGSPSKAAGPSDAGWCITSSRSH